MYLYIICVIPYSRKYWQSLNLVAWSQTNSKKYWQNLNLAVAGTLLRIRHHEHCMHVYHSLLEVLQQSWKFAKI